MTRSRSTAVVRAMLSTACLLSGASLQAQEAEDRVEHGRVVYNARCAYCHDPVPEGSRIAALPGVDQLMLKYGGELSPYITERADLASFAVLRAFLRNGAGSMQPFRKTELTDEDIAALAAYLRTTASP